MISLRTFLPAAAVVAIGLLAGTAKADCGGYGVGNCWFGNLNAYGASGTLYGSGYLPVPPYFAIHPPVYYSQRYARPYGWSPFAQSASCGPAMLRPEPRMIVNTFVPAKAKAVADEKENTAQSQWIDNPYFVKASKTGQGRLVSAE